MSITLTANYKETIAPEIVEVIDNLVENGYPLEDVLTTYDYFVDVLGGEYVENLEEIVDILENIPVDRSDLYDFIQQYEIENLKYYEKYYELVEDYNKEAVDSFIDCFDIDDLNLFSETYKGYFESVDCFVDHYLEMYGVDIPTWVCIDASATWESALRYDFYEENGHYFKHL